MSTLLDYWRQAFEEVLYKSDDSVLIGLRRGCHNLRLDVPGGVMLADPGFTLPDVGYTVKHKTRNWMKFYLSEGEMDICKERIKSYKYPQKSNFYVSFPLRLVNKSKDGSVAGTKGHCLLDSVVTLYRGSEHDKIQMRVFIVSRVNDITKTFGADLLLSRSKIVIPLYEFINKEVGDTELNQATFYTCAPYIVTTKSPMVGAFPNYDKLLKRAWKSFKNKSIEERKYFRAFSKIILKTIENPSTVFKYRTSIKLSELYRTKLRKKRKAVKKLVKEVNKNLGYDN